MYLKILKLLQNKILHSITDKYVLYYSQLDIFIPIIFIW